MKSLMKKLMTQVRAWNRKEWGYSHIRQYFLNSLLMSSVADPGYLSWIPDPNFFIPDPGSEFFPFRIRMKEFKYFNSKNCF
jgi:hypothetical protein